MPVTHGDGIVGDTSAHPRQRVFGVDWHTDRATVTVTVHREWQWFSGPAAVAGRRVFAGAPQARQQKQ